MSRAPVQHQFLKIIMQMHQRWTRGHFFFTQPNQTHQLTDPTHRSSTWIHQTHPLNSKQSKATVFNNSGVAKYVTYVFDNFQPKISGYF